MSNQVQYSSHFCFHMSPPKGKPLGSTFSGRYGEVYRILRVTNWPKGDDLVVGVCVQVTKESLAVFGRPLLLQE